MDLAPVPPRVAMEPPDFIAPEVIELPDDIEPDFIGAPFVDTGWSAWGWPESVTDKLTLASIDCAAK